MNANDVIESSITEPAGRDLRNLRHDPTRKWRALEQADTHSPSQQTAQIAEHMSDRAGAKVEVLLQHEPILAHVVTGQILQPEAAEPA